MNNNKLIAEFMGLQFSKGEYYRPLFNSGDWIPQDELQYHTSWDWLMPVVSKCREESNAEDSHWEAIYYSLEGCDIDVTYQAIVEFIKEYNDEK